MNALRLGLLSTVLSFSIAGVATVARAGDEPAKSDKVAPVAPVKADKALAESDDFGVVGAQFGDKIEAGKPIGDGKASALVAYFVEVKNPGKDGAVTLVWSHDGKETARQSLDVGTSPKWRTWGMAPARGAKQIEVRVLSPTGRELRKDVLER